MHDDGKTPGCTDELRIEFSESAVLCISRADAPATAAPVVDGVVYAIGPAGLSAPPRWPVLGARKAPRNVAVLCVDTRVVDAAQPLRHPDTVLARYAFAARDDDAAALLAAAGDLAAPLLLDAGAFADAVRRRVAAAGACDAAAAARLTSGPPTRRQLAALAALAAAPSDARLLRVLSDALALDDPRWDDLVAFEKVMLHQRARVAPLAYVAAMLRGRQLDENLAAADVRRLARLAAVVQPPAAADLAALRAEYAAFLRRRGAPGCDAEADGLLAALRAAAALADACPAGDRLAPVLPRLVAAAVGAGALPLPPGAPLGRGDASAAADAVLVVAAGGPLSAGVLAEALRVAAAAGVPFAAVAEALVP